MTSEPEDVNPNHIEEFHRSPCDNNPTSSEQSDSEDEVSAFRDYRDEADEGCHADSTPGKKVESSEESQESAPKRGLSANARKVDVQEKNVSESHRRRSVKVMKDSRSSHSNYTAKGKRNINKRLLYNNEDEEDDDKSSASSRELAKSPLEQAKTPSTMGGIECDNVEAKNGHCDEQESSSTKTTGEIKIAASVESEQGELDASSTSSCSCEDHSSVNGSALDVSKTEPATSGTNRHSLDEEILIDDLDYNEDSMSDDSARESGRQLNRLASERRLSYEKDDQNVGGKSNVTYRTKANDRDNHNNNNHKHYRQKLNKSHSPTPSPETPSRELKRRKTSNRIKSFINRSQHQEEDACEMDDDELDRGNGSESRERILASLVASKSKKSCENLMKYFYKDACYFQVKSFNFENVELAKSMGVWATPMHNEVRFNAAFREHRNVILIFSVQQSGAFQGFARMVSESRQPAKPIPWVLPEALIMKPLGGVFKLEWLCTKELAFHEIPPELCNPFNGNKPVKVARDGQQVSSKIGKKLCKLFAIDEKDKKKLLNSIATLKYQTSQRRKSSHKQDNFYPLPDARSSLSHQGAEERYARRSNYMAHHLHGPGAMNGFSPAPYPVNHPHGFAPMPNHHQHPHHHLEHYVNSFHPGHINYPTGDHYHLHYQQHPANLRLSNPNYNNQAAYYNRPGALYPPPAAYQSNMSNGADETYHQHHYKNLPMAYEGGPNTLRTSEPAGRYRKSRR